MNKKHLLVSILMMGTALLFSCSSSKSTVAQPEELTGIIDADNANIQYFGRFNHSNTKRVVFDWSGVYIRASFQGTSCAIRLEDSSNLYAVTIDDGLPVGLTTDTSDVYTVATELADTVHTIQIDKRTEAFVGKAEFLGFVLDKGKTLVEPEPVPDRRIEFIGNSITCGYGVEAPGATSSFSPETENATLSYAALVGRSLNADYRMIAYSGRGVVRNYGDANQTSSEPMPALYDRTCCADATPAWDFTSWVPQVVVINLGTNDFSTQPHPDKDVFQQAYTQLITRVQAQYANVTIFCICGPMIGAPCSTYIEETVGQCQQNNANNKIYYIPVKASLMTSTDWGADWHPNQQGQQKIADMILPVIEEAMGW